MQGSGMADKLRALMQKKQGGKSSFTMTGQYAGSVEREGDREYVMYESPNGEQIKVYGNWNEYAVSRDEQGRDMIADEDYPIIQNENGEYVLDEVRHNENMDTAYEREPVERMARETEMESTQGASKIENLLEKLQDARGPRRLPGRFEEGGKLPDPVKKMERKIVEMLEGGASDKEISKVVRESGLDKDYVFNWDNVEMRVVSFKKKDHSQFNDDFGPKDEGGQRGDMFAGGGKMTYAQGGQLDPEPPEWIKNDPNFQDVRYRGNAKGEPDSDFRYDLKGVKFYGWDDDGLVFIDKNGNEFSADRTTFKGDRNNPAQRDDESLYHDMFDYLQSMGATGSDEFEVKAHGARGGFRPESAEGLLKNLQKMRGPGVDAAFRGPFGGQGASKTEDLLERLRDVRRRR